MIKARKKILLLGNHDARGAYKDLFSKVYAGPLFISDKILLSHEPVFGLTWCLNIHGHDHNNTEAYKDGCKHINLLSLVDDNTLKFGIGVELSYLTKDEQQTLLDIMKQESVKPSLIQAKDLHRMSKDGECTEAAMFKLLTVVAEGVENARQWNFLIDHGCDLLQGYFAAEPLSEAEFFDFYNRIEVE